MQRPLPPAAPARPWARHALALATVALVAACGGGGGGDSAAPAATTPTTPTAPVAPVVEKPATRSEAARFLTQATFGPTEADIDRVMAVGYAAWVDEQLARAVPSYRATWEAADAAAKARDPNSGVWQGGVYNAFWQHAVTSDAQLRLRVGFALSEIFVISMAGNVVGEFPRAVSAWLDMLNERGMGKYRDLLEGVALHPQMGLYLSHLKNQKADAKTGRVPDENFAREVMQLFSIGLAPLNLDGTVRSGGGNTYSPADIAGLAKVFTGWSWDCPDGPDNSCFFWGEANGSKDPDRDFKPMQGFAQFHSADEKAFLGVTIARQTRADPYASMKVALDTLAAHPNVGPFIGKQLIQRLVTSNPSPAYVRAVAEAFNTGGGDMKAMVKAVLMHPEARVASNTAGKVREPILKLSALLRAFPHTSDGGNWAVDNTENASNSLGQAPLTSPSVFNFFRPGYVSPGSAAATAGLVAPELQIAHETTAAGYVNFVRDAVSSGVGNWNSTTSRRDIQPDYSAELALADQPAALVERINTKLLVGGMPAALKSEIQATVEKITLPTLNATGSNQKSIDTAKRNRVNAALFLALVSPEFAVQK